MKNSTFICFLTAVLLLTAGCASKQEPHPYETRDAFLKFVQNEKFYHLENFDKGIEGELSQRIYTAPPLVVDYLNRIEITSTLEAYDLSDEQKSRVKEGLSRLPNLNRKLLTENLQGIYFIKNWKGAGMLDITLTPSGEIKTVLILNPEILEKTASEWITFREQSTFKENKKYSVEIKVSEEISALDYILLHESFHAVDLYRNFTPALFPEIQYLTNSPIKTTPFTENIWLEYNTPVEKFDYPDRDKLHFYYMHGRARITRARAVKVYRDLERTPFISLYGSQSWAEDFADFMTMYTLTRIMGSPYEVLVNKKDEIVYSGSPMEKSILSGRIAMAEEILK